MARKYRSMQEELEARKKAGVYGDLSQFEKRMFHDEPEWVKKSREDAERSRKISQAQQALTGYITDLLDRDTDVSAQIGERVTGYNADTKKNGKWSLRGKKTAEKRASRQAEKTEKAIDLQNLKQVFEEIKKTAAEQKAQSAGQTKNTAADHTYPGRTANASEWTAAPSYHPSPAARKTSAGRKPQKKRSGCVIPILIVLVLLPILGAIYEIIFDISNTPSDFFDQNHTYEYFGTYEEDGELSVYSSYVEAENFIMDVYYGGEADSEDLYFWFFDNGAYTLLNENSSVDVAVSPEDGSCYLMIWAECSADDDPGEVMASCTSFTEDMWAMLNDAGYTDIPVCIILKETEAWELRLVMIDTEPFFASDEYCQF